MPNAAVYDNAPQVRSVTPRFGYLCNIDINPEIIENPCQLCQHHQVIHHQISTQEVIMQDQLEKDS